MAFFVMVLILLIISLVVSYAVWNGIGPTPTSPKVKALILKNLPIIEEGPIIEAGAGFGMLCFALAKHYNTHLVIAYENSPIPFLVLRLFLLLFPQPNLRIVYQDFWNVSFSEASLIFCYLYPGAMVRMKEKEVKQGAWLITHTFSIHGWTAEKTLQADDLYHSKIFLYCKKTSRQEQSAPFKE